MQGRGTGTCVPSGYPGRPVRLGEKSVFQTAVFGDYLNDLELYDRAGLSFAVANAHPRVLARARYIAPANDEGGVTRTLRALLERMG